ncbi:hypothetical protein FZ983_28085 [Azospirillum sp. B21]|nr:hypothetical protein FZ983_28085 [Azospirillum sp. B21]
MILVADTKTDEHPALSADDRRPPICRIDHCTRGGHCGQPFEKLLKAGISESGFEGLTKAAH